MTESTDKDFPGAFGKSVDNFLKRYENIIYKMIREALKATFTKISQRQKLIFDRTYFIKMSVKEIAYYLNIKPEEVYVTNRKVKEILGKELKKRGIDKKRF